MNPNTESDSLQPSLEQLKNLFKRYDIQGQESMPEDFYTHMRKSCVLVPLFLKGDQWHVMLTVRSSRLRYHPSAVAFPGGNRDESDVDAERTALREAEEEIGLSDTQVEIVARLFPCITSPEYCVSVFVGIIPPDFVPKVHSNEVDQVFDVPLKMFVEKNYTVEEANYHGIKFDVPYFSVPDKPLTVWGLTAYICIMVAFIAYRIRHNFRFLHDVAHAQYEEEDIFADYKLFFFFGAHRSVLNAKGIHWSKL